MAKEYKILINVAHVVYVVADSDEEAEELAMDEFSDDAGFWDDFDIDILSEEEL
jgi:hypothetical protein